jgi:hypothetical protein
VRQFAALAMAEAPVLAEEILQEIQREYPHLPVVLETAEGRPRVHPEVFQEFGRGEGMHGRSLDSLQAIYRLGVRLAWRRFAEIGQRVEIPPPAMYELVDAGYEYLDGLVDQSVRGYAEAAARQAGERLRLQRRLMELLLSEHHHRGDPAEALVERAARVGAARRGRRRGAAAPGPRGGRARRGTERAARHGVRAAPHGRARAGRGGSPGAAAPRADRLGGRDRAAGAAR